MTQKIKIGDTVALKSGGPIMTVEKIYFTTPEHRNVEETEADSTAETVCQWFENTKLNEGYFPVKSLEKR